MSKFVLWGLKGLITLAFVASGIMKLTGQPMLVESMNALGYPLMLMTILGSAYILGVIAIWQPMIGFLREWGYAGLVIAMVGAAASHIMNGDPISLVMPSVIILILVLVASFMDRQASS